MTTYFDDENLADDNVTKNSSHSSSLPINPYPGLRPFIYNNELNESVIFKGRSRQIGELVSRLSSSHLVAVVGPSGCGKSSLVLAGLIPALEAGQIYEAGADWSSNSFRPGINPIRSMAATLSKILCRDTQPTAEEVDKWINILNDGENGLLAFHQEYQQQMNGDTNLLLVVDQFEELFREDLSNFKQAHQVIALILSVFLVKPESLYVVITMRTDYYEQCGLFMGLPDALNITQYFTPRLNSSDLKDAITIPAKRFGGSVSSELEALIVQEMHDDLGYDRDNLPLMQHSLMWLWNKAKDRKDNPIELKLKDYKKIGGSKSALSIHANEVYKELSISAQSTARKMFTLMGVKDDGGRVRRRITSSREVIDCGGTKEDIDEIAKVFGSESCSFIRSVGQAVDTWDVTHECFLRQWNKLDNWIQEESDFMIEMFSLCSAYNEYKSDRRGLLDDKEIVRFTHLKKDSSMRMVRGLKYDAQLEKSFNTTIDNAIKFLEDSELELGKNKQRIRGRLVLGCLVFTIIITVGLGYYYNFKENALTREKHINMLSIASNFLKEAQISILQDKIAHLDREKRVASQAAQDFQMQARNLVVSGIPVRYAIEAYSHYLLVFEDDDMIGRGNPICSGVRDIFLHENYSYLKLGFDKTDCENISFSDHNVFLKNAKESVCREASTRTNIKFTHWKHGAGGFWQKAKYPFECKNQPTGIHAEIFESIYKEKFASNDSGDSDLSDSASSIIDLLGRNLDWEGHKYIGDLSDMLVDLTDAAELLWDGNASVFKTNHPALAKYVEINPHLFSDIEKSFDNVNPSKLKLSNWYDQIIKSYNRVPLINDEIRQLLEKTCECGPVYGQASQAAKVCDILESHSKNTEPLFKRTVALAHALGGNTDTAKDIIRSTINMLGTSSYKRYQHNLSLQLQGLLDRIQDQDEEFYLKPKRKEQITNNCDGFFDYKNSSTLDSPVKQSKISLR